MKTRGQEEGPGLRTQGQEGPEWTPRVDAPLHAGHGVDPGCAPRPSPGPRSSLGPRASSRSSSRSSLGPGWTLSFAGCGFRSVYYVGALCCLLERVPELVRGAARFSGASSGSLVAAALAVDLPLSVLVTDLVAMATEARSLWGGVFHPSFSLLRRARDSLLLHLPLDAHLRASSRLLVSLTRVHDGKNLLVSRYRSREELVQVLLCSCFFPVYCGFIPPKYNGESYMDGALSDNQPLCEVRNSLLFSPFSGESDICPRESGHAHVQVCFGNVSIEVNTGNVHRVWTSFLPQSPEVLMQMCVNGYTDALRFLSDSGPGPEQGPEPGPEPGPGPGQGPGQTLDSVKSGQDLCGDVSRVLVQACCSAPLARPSHFSDAPLVHVVLGLVLDLVLGLVLDLNRLVLLLLRLMHNLCVRRAEVGVCGVVDSVVDPGLMDQNRDCRSERPQTTTTTTTTTTSSVK